VRESKYNPPQNRLPEGLEPPLIEAALTASGYPTQSVAASILSSDFSVVEEWGFTDKDTGDSRSLDIFAFHAFEGSAVKPGLFLLVECKRSTSPLIFFKAATQRDVTHFPLIVGGVSPAAFITSPSGSMYRPLSEILGLHRLPFSNVVPACTGVAKAVRKGKELDLTGTEMFNATVRPLCGALDYGLAFYKLPTAQEVVYPRVALAVAVVDAPMLLADYPTPDESLELTPWIRIFRQVARRSNSGDRPETLHYCVDFVHLHFLSEFMKAAIIFAETFADRSAQRPYLFTKAAASAPTLGQFSWTDIKEPPAR